MKHTARHQRQMLIPAIGEPGQQRLRGASVLVAGAGGLGCPALLYLAAAGVGQITVVDHDQVDITNLNRQILFGPEDIGKPKAERAADILRSQFPDCRFTAIQASINQHHVLSMLSSCDLILDATDRFETRYLLSDACGILNKPLVYGAALALDGQMAVFHHPDSSGQRLSYRDLHPQPPAAGTAPNCAEAGVVGAVTGVIGSMMAAAAIRILTGMPAPEGHRLSWYSMNGGLTEFRVTPKPHPEAPCNENELKSYNYPLFCNMSASNDTITKEQFASMAPSCTVIDIRETWETPELSGVQHLRIPMGELREHLDEIPKDKTIILMCEGGKRSAAACLFLRRQIPGAEILSLEGGIKNLYGIE